jgi:Flp pilus assembly protein TadG
VMETALRDSARLIRTGQAHANGMTAAAFKADVCGRLSGLISCSTGVTVDVREYSQFSGIDWSRPGGGGNFDPNSSRFTLGQPGSIIVARAFYQAPSYANLLGSSLSNQPNGTILLVATSVFRNEPFQLAANR